MPVAGPVLGAVAGAVVSSALAPDGGGGGPSQADSAAAAASLKQAEIAEKQWKYYEDNFQPFEKDYLLPTGKKLIDGLDNYGSQAEQDQAAGEASTGVALSMGKAKDAFERNMASYGINPASGRFNDANLKMSLEGAKADAGAQNLARKGVRDAAFGKKIDAINTALNINAIGRGLPASAQTGLASAAANNAAIGNAQYLRSTNEASLARAGVAPIASAISKGVSNWFNTPTPTYEGTVANYAQHGINLTDMSNPAYG